MLNSLRRIQITLLSFFYSPTYLIALIIFSFELKQSNATRWILLITLVSVASHKRVISSIRQNWGSLAYFIFAVEVSFLLFNEKPNRALQFLSYGYDNAFHFTLFRGFLETSNYPKVDVENWFTDFQLFTKVPLGFHSFMSFIAEPFTLGVEDPANLLSVYSSIQVFSVFLLGWLVFKFLIKITNATIGNLVLCSVMSLILVFCLASTLLFNGFAPYFWSLIVIMIWLDFDSTNEVKWRKNLALSLSIYSVTMMTPAPATPLIFLALSFFIRELLEMKKGQKTITPLLNISPFILLGGLVLWSFNRTSAGLGWRQILQPGGLQNINTLTTAFIFIITISLLIKNYKQIPTDNLSLIVVFGICSTGFLASLTIALTGNLQYYVIKQIYVSLFFNSLYVVKTLCLSKNLLLSNGILASLLIYPVLNPIFFTGAYMGVAPRVLSHTLNANYWITGPINSDKIIGIADLGNDKTGACYIWRVNDRFSDADLSSRWINALKSTDLINEKCFSSYWNNQSFSDSELLSKLEQIDNQFVIITDKVRIKEGLGKITFKGISK